MKSLPPCVAHLHNLLELRIEYCKNLAALPLALACLLKLQHLTIEYCAALKVVPAIVCRLSGLTGLYCNCNSFSFVPDDIMGDLTNLRVLSFNGKTCI
jgi:Leucine-rich repeat (LRR) protein